MDTRMVSMLALLVVAACRSALPNPEAPTEPALWAAERESARKASAPTAAAREVAVKEELAEPPKREEREVAASEGSSSASEPSPAVAARKQAQGTQGVPGSGSAPAGGDPVVAVVAGQGIGASELLKQWLHRDSFEVFQQINYLVASKLVLLESGRLGIAADEAAVEKEYKAAVEEMEGTIQKKRPGVTLDKYVDSYLGLDPLRYRETLRANALRGWLASRCVRAWVLQSEHANVRLIALKSEDELKAAQADLAAGKSFEEVAQKRSGDPSAKEGGRIPPVVKSNSPMGKLAFATAVGAVGGPQYEQGAWLLVKVESRPEPLKGGWKEIGGAVEASLKERAIDDIEYKQWETAMQGRYQIDLTPVLKLCGEPVK